jgi:hypothetical protein
MYKAQVKLRVESCGSTFGIGHSGNLCATLEDISVGHGSVLQLVAGNGFNSRFLSSDWSPRMSFISVLERVRSMISTDEPLPQDTPLVVGLQ